MSGSEEVHKNYIAGTGAGKNAAFKMMTLNRNTSNEYPHKSSRIASGMGGSSKVDPDESQNSFA